MAIAVLLVSGIVLFAGLGLIVLRRNANIGMLLLLLSWVLFSWIVPMAIEDLPAEAGSDWLASTKWICESFVPGLGLVLISLIGLFLYKRAAEGTEEDIDLRGLRPATAAAGTTPAYTPVAQPDLAWWIYWIAIIGMVVGLLVFVCMVTNLRTRIAKLLERPTPSQLVVKKKELTKAIEKVDPTGSAYFLKEKPFQFTLTRQMMGEEQSAKLEQRIEKYLQDRKSNLKLKDKGLTNTTITVQDDGILYSPLFKLMNGKDEAGEFSAPFFCKRTEQELIQWMDNQQGTFANLANVVMKGPAVPSKNNSGYPTIDFELQIDPLQLVNPPKK